MILALRIFFAGGRTAATRHIALRVKAEETTLRRGFWNNYAVFSDAELAVRLEELFDAQQRPREQVNGWDTWQETEWRLIHAIESQALLAVIAHRESSPYAPEKR